MRVEEQQDWAQPRPAQREAPGVLVAEEDEDGREVEELAATVRDETEEEEEPGGVRGRSLKKRVILVFFGLAF